MAKKPTTPDAWALSIFNEVDKKFDLYDPWAAEHFIEYVVQRLPLNAWHRAAFIESDDFPRILAEAREIAQVSAYESPFWDDLSMWQRHTPKPEKSAAARRAAEGPVRTIVSEAIEMVEFSRTERFPLEDEEYSRTYAEQLLFRLPTSLPMRQKFMWDNKLLKIVALITPIRLGRSHRAASVTST